MYLRKIHVSSSFEKTGFPPCCLLNGSFEVAFETLSSVEKRRQYDESLGLAAHHRSRLKLRPLGMFSQSLSKAQQNWTTWELPSQLCDNLTLETPLPRAAGPTAPACPLQMQKNGLPSRQ